MRTTLAIILALLLGSCSSYRFVEGGFTGGIKIRESLNAKSPIIFGRVKVFDNSRNLSDNNTDIADSCIIFVGNDPLVPKTMFYRFNWPNIGNKASVYKGLFAIQLTEDFEKNNLNIACGTEYYARKQSKLFWDGIVEYRSYLRLDIEKPIIIESGDNKAFYLGDIEISIPANATIANAKKTLGEGMVSDFIGDYYRPAIKSKIDFNSKVVDDFKKTSKDINELLPFLEKDFVFSKAILR